MIAPPTKLVTLTEQWSLLADLSFSDLLLYVPVGEDGFEVLRQVRPMTAQTLYEHDIVGERRTATQRPYIAQAYSSCRVRHGEVDSPWLGERLHVVAIPVAARHASRDRVTGAVVPSKSIAVVARESAPDARPHPGRLERVYEAAFDRFAQMITTGRFPFPPEEEGHGAVPRVGDGVLVVDRSGAVEYSSPNATSTLTRAGRVDGAGGPDAILASLRLAALTRALRTGYPGVEEVDLPGDVTIVVRALPFLDADGVPTGAMVLLRDVTDLRRRDRLLVSKDATISEIHHRVKNNLQTVSSLLRLQGSRLVEPTARAAIDESVRRIRSIATVHETLSRGAGDDVEFADVLRPLVRMVHDGLVSTEQPIRFVLRGEGGVVSSEVATPLSLVITELLQNAVEHAFAVEPSSAGVPPTEGGSDGGGDDADGGQPQVAITLVRLHEAGSERIRVEVRDNGAGLDPAEDHRQRGSLGYSIVQALVVDELRGGVTYHSHGPGKGTTVTIEVPVDKWWTGHADPG
ncbi:MAG: histidine kinase N-terminal domain-containing protein [Microthrixaceae bacterium]